jgi:putative transposase
MLELSTRRGSIGKTARTTLHSSGKAYHLAGGAAGGSNCKRGMPEASDCGHSILRVGEASEARCAGGAGSPGPQRETSTDQGGSAANGGISVEGGGSSSHQRECESEKGGATGVKREPRQRSSADDKRVLLDAIQKMIGLGRVTVGQAAQRLCVSRATYYRWKGRDKADSLSDLRPEAKGYYGPLPEEEQAVMEYAKSHPRDGYRRLCWQMVDEDVAFLSPSAVYRILDRHDLLYRWKRSSASSGKKPRQASHPDEVWHTDLMYLWVAGRWYFLVSVLDSYSRYIVVWDLVLTLAAAEVVNVVHPALEARPGLKPRMVRDNGSQFVAREWRQMVAHFGLVDIPIRVRHPESNGRIERYHRSVREEGLGDTEPKDLYEARKLVADWVDFYNHRRLHAGLQYLRPVDYYRYDPDELLRERQRKLAEATKIRNANRTKEAGRD